MHGVVNEGARYPTVSPPIVVSRPELVRADRYDPTADEQGDNGDPPHGEVVAQGADRVPEPAPQLQAVADQPEGLDRADSQRDDGRDGGDREVVVQLPERLHERPPIR